ncbi:MAG: prepilin-type N-terminal cleavage/methylation domain-containing protein [Patescibacteria group bacterium]
MIGVSFFKKAENKSGFTLVEVLVATTIFVVIMLSATSIFKYALEGQKKSLMSQNVQESLRYFLEVIGKEIRMAQRDNGVCTSTPDTQIFASSTNAFGDVLEFKNYHGQCVRYYLFGAGDFTRFTVKRDTAIEFISPLSVDVSDLRFLVEEEEGKQAFVTVSFKGEAVTPSGGRAEAINVQTSIVSRYYPLD